MYTTAKRVADGAISFSNCNGFASWTSPAAVQATPLTLPAGLANDLTSPSSAGVATPQNTIGMARVACAARDRSFRSVCVDHVDSLSHELLGETRKPFLSSIRTRLLDDEVATFDPAELSQAHRDHAFLPTLRNVRDGAENTDHTTLRRFLANSEGVASSAPAAATTVRRSITRSPCRHAAAQTAGR